ncbi:MAG TPA: hypothetical protein ENF30_01210 [Candidatus Desulfofervidus auxilii]|uniref:Diguanylate cyclase n=1 Tax=Desulfofervidus auxilii TaxID=1621989 RepID=A0A7V0IA37_DESA2|nr:hypothetical protein [Candidatus Desulfofervidus auxilii]
MVREYEKYFRTPSTLPYRRIEMPSTFKQRVIEELNRLARYYPNGAFSIVYLKVTRSDGSNVPDYLHNSILNAIERSVRASDVIGHNDKLYFLLLPYTDREGARKVSKKLKNNIESLDDLVVTTGFEEIRLKR